MKPFARYNDADNHDRLVRGLFKEKKIRERLKYITQIRAKGFEKLYEGEDAEKLQKEVEIPLVQPIIPIKVLYLLLSQREKESRAIYTEIKSQFTASKSKTSAESIELHLNSIQ